MAVGCKRRNFRRPFLTWIFCAAKKRWKPKTGEIWTSASEGALFFSGSYLLLKVFWRPLETGESAIIAAGVLLALASVLLFYMVRTRFGEALAGKEEVGEIEDELDPFDMPLTAYGATVETRTRAELALDDELPGPM